MSYTNSSKPASSHLLTDAPIGFVHGFKNTLFQELSSLVFRFPLQYRYQAGKVQINHNRFLGYSKDDEGNLIIEPTEAAVIKRIYREYLEGASYNIEQASIKKRILESKRYGHPRVEGGIILFYN